MKGELVDITGRGVLTPAGAAIADFWSAVQAGHSTARSIDRFDSSAHRVRIGCQVEETNATGCGDSKATRRTDRFTRYALSAAKQAVTEAGIADAAPTRVAVVVGNAVGGRDTSDRESIHFAQRGPGGVNPLMPLMTMPNAAAARISIDMGWQGPAYTMATTCASGADALGLARALLWSDIADIVVAGGAEATLTPVTMAAFGGLDALSTRNDDPGTACRPFDMDRDGFVMSEGAAFVVLERHKDAQARGATIHGSILGYASTSDAHHLSAPHPNSDGAVAAMRGALTDAGISPSDIGHINAHGTSTKLNDAAEARAIRQVFGHASPPVTATKGVTGHMLGASGAAEVIATLLAMTAGAVPPVANYTTHDPEVDLDIVQGNPRKIRPAPALSNSFGFGGHNACLVLG